ncbi:GNAT family N-acetyltransferase [Staphylococcus caeli]|uniref:Acetyltransferase n=1 Tax=Staphylococcus caeli TaxID=2201815 RepID=A0A1D4KNW8_9STAP|nr:GNAT family N-acetyltransferase [Staphylococcus caeli]SCS73100.1 acetyltransferase [Staphylococcus caeli]SCS75625.1 acetyltransferase [Staphylococcus caeli]
MKITQLNSYEQIVTFINDADYHSASYLYKLPQAHEDVEATIKQAIEDPGVFAQLDDQNDIVMLLLAFKYEDNKYKVIGPFVKKSVSLSKDDFKSLFAALAQSKPDTANFNFSFEENEQAYAPYMKAIEASYSFTDYHLISTQDVGKVDHAQNITEYRPAYYRSFKKLHDYTFKHDVMTTDEITESLDEYNKLFVFMSEGLLKGYLYIQIFPATKRAEIKYFSSHADYRFMGIAFDLLSYALQFTFSNYNIERVYFKIRSKNNTLVERFHELGFNINYEYKKFKYVAAHL